MAGRRRVALVALLLMVVALVVHAASQDSATIAAVGHPAAAGDVRDADTSLAHGSTFADPEHAALLADDSPGPVPPSCPQDRRSAHDEAGALAPRAAAGPIVLALPALSGESPTCTADAEPLTTGRSVPVAPVSGVALCNELCVSRR